MSEYREPADFYGEDWRRFYCALLPAVVKKDWAEVRRSNDLVRLAAEMADTAVKELKKREGK